jgi:hypothetical protein
MMQMGSGMLRVMIATRAWQQCHLCARMVHAAIWLVERASAPVARPKSNAVHSLIREAGDSRHCFLIIMPHQMTRDWLLQRLILPLTVPFA